MFGGLALFWTGGGRETGEATPPGERRGFRRVDTPGKGRIRQDLPQASPGELNGVRIALGGPVGKRGW